MVWALGALLLQLPAIPQIVVPAASMMATVEAVEASAAATESGAAVSEKLMLLAAPSSAAAPALEPGRLTPAPVAPADSSPAAPSSSSSFAPGFAPGFAPVISVAKPAGQVGRYHRVAWVGLAVAQHSAAAFDAWSTRHAISSGRARELNPMLRPFAGNSSLYAATQVAPTLLDYLGRRMMTSRHSWARHTWWLPQVLGTAASLASGVHNLGVR